MSSGISQQMKTTFFQSGTFLVHPWSILVSDRQNNEHIRENRIKNRTNIRQNRILQNNPNIFFFILLELYWIIRLNISVLILQNNQTELLSWCLWVCFKSVKCYPQKQLGTLISMFNVHCVKKKVDCCTPNLVYLLQTLGQGPQRFSWWFVSC